MFDHGGAMLAVRSSMSLSFMLQLQIRIRHTVRMLQIIMRLLTQTIVIKPLRKRIIIFIAAVICKVNTCFAGARHTPDRNGAHSAERDPGLVGHNGRLGAAHEPNGFWSFKRGPL